MLIENKRYLCLLVVTVFLLTGCETVYYNAWEKVGVHKRNILVDRIEDTRDAQQDAQKAFGEALKQYRAVVNFDGGNLERQYNKLKREYDDSEAAATAISEHIKSVEDVAEDLFDEWEEELDQFENARLRESSAKQLHDTRYQYQRLLRNMKSAEKSVQPVLRTLHDQVLYLKHNLNARALSAMKGELATVNSDVNKLIVSMQASIDHANAFINQISQQ